MYSNRDIVLTTKGQKLKKNEINKEKFIQQKDDLLEKFTPRVQVLKKLIKPLLNLIILLCQS